MQLQGTMQGGARRAWTAAEARAVVALVALAAGLAAAAALAASLAWSPAELGAGAPLAALGLEPGRCQGCALCGLSRGFAHASRGELAAALCLNPLVAVAYPLAWLAVAGAPLSVRVLWRSWRSACGS